MIWTNLVPLVVFPQIMQSPHTARNYTKEKMRVNQAPNNNNMPPSTS